MTEQSAAQSELPPPSELGLPERYSFWRPNQSAAVERATTTEKRFVGLVAPTGFGKSVTAEAIAVLHGGRSVYNVVNRALQEQIFKDMPHRFNIWGKGNYDCHVLMDNGFWGAQAKCDRAEHLCEGCKLKDRGCSYFDDWRRAKRDSSIVTNYSYWLAINRYNEEGIGEYNLQINDEFHNAPDQLAKSLKIELRPTPVERFTRRPLPPTQPLPQWRDWASEHLTSLAPQLESLVSHARTTGKQPAELRELKALVGALTDLRAANGEWVEDRNQRSGEISFEPVWPAPYLNQLTRGIPHVLCMSATIRPKTFELMGIPAEQTEFLEFPSSFPVANRPVIHIKTVQMRYDMSDAQKLEMVRRVDQIIDGRLDRKGIVHTVSFVLADYIYTHSRHRNRFIRHEQGTNATSYVKRLVEARPESGAILLSPSVDEGYDFPHDVARYQVIAKVPFLDRRSPVARARMTGDPDYGNYATMQKLIQMCGRPVRSESDWAETFIVDNQFTWLYVDCVKRGFVPQWFQPAVQVNQTIPRAPKLERMV